MKVCRKLIAVFTSQADSTYQKNILTGIMEEAIANDINVAVFSSFIKEGTPDTFRMGERNIYNLPNFSLIDAVIIVPDTIKFSGVNEDLLTQIKNANKPVITIDYEYDGIPSVWHDDTSDIELLVDHLIDVHGCEIIDFYSGIKGHPHSLMREKGYINSLNKHGIPVEQSRIHYGDFWVARSSEVADEICNSLLPLPQGIACVCNPSAESLAKNLIEKGYKIPEDFKIVGYDASYEETHIESDVTTMHRNAIEAGRNATRYFVSLFTGKSFSKVQRLEPSVLMTTNSCGCGINKNQNKIYNLKPQGRSVYDNDQGFDSGYNFMMETMIDNHGFQDLLWQISWYSSMYIEDFDKFYICLCSDWVDLNDLQNDNYRKSGFSDEITNIFTKSPEKGNIDFDNKFPKGVMLPQLFEDRDEPAVFIFSPLHFNDHQFGYTVLEYYNKARVYNPEFAIWMRNVNNVFESVRRQIRLEHLNKKLKSMYDTMEKISQIDMLTGALNRNSFNKKSIEMFNRAKEENLDMFVLLSDMNNLKIINDTFGHICGDECIIALAKVLIASCTGNERCFRFGGDEFVILGIGEYNAESVERLANSIETRINNYNNAIDEQFKISVSIGYSYKSVKNVKSVDSIIASADELMFINKHKYKKRLGLSI